MPRRVSQNVSLTPEHAVLIAALVASGRYAGVSDAVRAAHNGFARQEGRATTSPSDKTHVARN